MHQNAPQLYGNRLLFLESLTPVANPQQLLLGPSLFLFPDQDPQTQLVSLK
jgi:hypothetical protein